MRRWQPAHNGGPLESFTTEADVVTAQPPRLLRPSSGASSDLFSVGSIGKCHGIISFVSILCYFKEKRESIQLKNEAIL